MSTPRRSGRRPGDARTREQILDAARDSFGANGYDGTTIRGVADAARVDPALVHYFFGTKDRLFASAMDIPVSPTVVVEDVLAGGAGGLGERLARRFLALWDDPETGPPLIGLIRGAASHERSADQIRGFVGEIVGRLAAAIGLPDAELRANLCAAQLIGISMGRYVLKVEPLASADPERIVAWLGPTLERYLTGDSPDRAVG